jgi:type IX secretion system PorP/SprF family membrane protein
MGYSQTIGCRRAVLFILLFVPFFVFAQADIHSSQFYETTLLRNPALVGVFADNYKFSSLYRSQWSSITYPYQTLQLSGEYRFSLGRDSYDFISIGLLGYLDQAGDLNQKIAGVYPAININKSLNQRTNSYLSFGFTAGYVQYSFEPGKATFNSQFQNGVFDPNNPTLETLPTPQMSITDVGAGVNFNASPGALNDITYMIGISAYHFIQPTFSYYSDYKYIQNLRFNVNASLAKEVNDNVLVQLQANYSHQGTYREIMGGCMVGYRSFAAFADPVFTVYLGFFYRYQDAMVPTFKLKYKSTSIGLSYDVNISSLTAASNARGGIELTAIITGTFPKNRGYEKKAPCPRF